MDTIVAYLPQHAGFLPKWLLLVGVISIGNSIQAYTTLYYTKRIYNLDPAKKPKSGSSTANTPALAYDDISQSTVTPLSARTFGTWTFVTSIVRIYAAYNIDNPIMYQLAIWTYAVAWLHFMSEWFIFGTTKWGSPLAGPIVVATTSLSWMILQRGYYLN